MKTYKFNPRVLLVFGFVYAIMGIILNNNKTQIELNFATSFAIISMVLIAVGASFETIEKE